MLRSTGKTVILVSHDIEFLWPIQPRMVVMSRGKVIADGEASKVMLDKEKLAGARVTQPQLVSFYQYLEARPKSAFVDDLDARRWVSQEMKRR